MSLPDWDVLMASPAEKPLTGASIVDVLDHVLDKGIVIDAWMRVSLAGIDLITVEARVLVTSIETYLQHAEAVAQVGGVVAGLRSQDVRPRAGLTRAPAPRHRALAHDRSHTVRSKRRSR